MTTATRPHLIAPQIAAQHADVMEVWFNPDTQIVAYRPHNKADVDTVEELADSMPFAIEVWPVGMESPAGFEKFNTVSSIEEAGAKRSLPKGLLNVAKPFMRASADYGQLWWHAATKTAILNMGDADDTKGIEAKLSKVPGVEKVEVADEMGKPTTPGVWLLAKLTPRGVQMTQHTASGAKPKPKEEPEPEDDETDESIRVELTGTCPECNRPACVSETVRCPHCYPPYPKGERVEAVRVGSMAELMQMNHVRHEAGRDRQERLYRDRHPMGESVLFTNLDLNGFPCDYPDLSEMTSSQAVGGFGHAALGTVKAKGGVCPDCGCDLRPNGKCPECGSVKEVDSAIRLEWALSETALTLPDYARRVYGVVAEGGDASINIQDIQDYFDFCVAKGMNHLDAKRKVKSKFKISHLEVNPMGRVESDDVEDVKPDDLNSPSASAPPAGPGGEEDGEDGEDGEEGEDGEDGAGAPPDTKEKPDEEPAEQPPAKDDGEA